MQYVILISGQPFAPTCITRAATATSTSLFAGDDGTYHFDMHDNSMRVRIEYAGNDLSDWEEDPERLARLKRLGSPAHVYIAHYKDVNRLRAVLVELANCADFVLDDDYEIFVDASEFAALCSAHPNENRWWLGGHYA